jgi:virginiamycin B lyase
MSIRANPPARRLAALAALFVASTLLAACAAPVADVPGTPTVPAATATPTRPPAGQLAEFPMPGAHSVQLNIIAGPGGNLWVSEFAGSVIYRVTPAGRIAEFPLPANTFADNITLGPDGNLWFTLFVQDGNTYRSGVGRITPSGAITLLPLPLSGFDRSFIAAGRDGHLWLAHIAPQAGNLRFDRFSPSGSGFTTFTLPSAVGPKGPQDMLSGFAAGPDGNLWATEFSYVHPAVLRVTPSGAITAFPLPLSSLQPAGVTAGPDGNVWITEAEGSGRLGNSRIVRVTPAGVATELPVKPGIVAAAITYGPDGNLWYGNVLGASIGRMTPAGVETEFPLPPRQRTITSIAAGPDGNIWFAEIYPGISNDTLGGSAAVGRMSA